MLEVEVEDFERMVSDAVHALPEQFRERIANVEFAVEDWARPDDFGRMHLPRNATLLGVYRGVPLTARGHGYNMALPDRIVIFRGQLQLMAHDEQDLQERVARVVRHEIAHYFGISDDRLHEIGAY